jgi:hypothetical protein
MSENRLLGHLAQRFAFSEENLATESLVWLMQSQAARSAMSGLMRVAGCEIPEALTYVGQVSAQDTGKPDVVAIDIDGIERILIEGKFGAALTDQQPAGYLERLPGDQDGILLVVAPSVRLSTLWVELLRAVSDLSTPIPAPSAANPGEYLYVPLTNHRTLALISWRRLVVHLLEALRAADQRTLAADAEQLLALTEVMDSAAYAPLRPQDLDQRTGHQVDQLHRLIDGTRNGIVNDPASLVGASRSRSSHGGIFYGWYLQSRRTRVQLWFGFLPWVWGRYGLSPLWLQTTQLWPRERWLQALGGLREPNQVGLFDEGDAGFLIPVHILRYAGEAEVVASLREQVEDIFARLDAVVPVDEQPAPDVDIAVTSDALEED